MTLSLYIAKRFLKIFLGVFAVFLAILFLIDMIEKVRDFGVDIGLSGAAHLAALDAPAGIYRILPLVMILASIALCLALARSSELVVIRASGRSALRALVPPVATAFLLGLVAVSFGNPIVAATQRQADILSARYSGQDRSALSITSEGLWLRQGGPEGQSVIHATRSNSDGTELKGATFLAFSPDAGPIKRVDAARAVLANGAWQLTDVKEWDLTSDNPERDAKVVPSLVIPSPLTASGIRDSFGAPSEIGIWQLPGFIQGLADAGFSTRRHAVWFQMELALPLLLSAMVLLGAGFTMRHARFGGTGMLVLLAVGAGFAIFFLRNFAQVLGENGQIPVTLAAWSPPLAAVLLSLGLLLHLEDG
ncbi:LPS export ABC transporter permease LptG [Frigidibacter sp. MR17.14]|uniref:LPS export ABC transporter permease LptG n=1 Tax=Frigidibacter sp. MR17.14 TaxID=3126509 RepID=UPI003012D462